MLFCYYFYCFLSLALDSSQGIDDSAFAFLFLHGYSLSKYFHWSSNGFSSKPSHGFHSPIFFTRSYSSPACTSTSSIRPHPILASITSVTSLLSTTASRAAVMFSTACRYTESLGKAASSLSVAVYTARSAGRGLGWW